MTTPPPDNHSDDTVRPPADPLRPDQIRCLCGATADRHGQCRKCRARALWDRRHRPERRQPTARPRSGRPRNRRPDR